MFIKGMKVGTLMVKDGSDSINVSVLLEEAVSCVV